MITTPSSLYITFKKLFLLLGRPWIESYFLNVENLNLEASNVNQLVSGIGLKSVTYEKEMESLKTDMVADCVESICLCFGVCYACRLIDHSWLYHFRLAR